MAWVRAPALALAMVALLLAGCLHRDGGDALESTSKIPANESNATCFGSCTGAAFQETNATVMTGTDSMDHMHDYWKGRERVTIFTEAAQMQPFPNNDGANYKATADFHPPQGSWVYEGTDRVEFTISDPMRHVCPGGGSTLGGYYICEDTLNNATGGPAPNLPAASDPTGGPSGLKLRYKHASASAWIDVGELVWGKPTIIKITSPTQTDMPHVTASAWAFEVVSPNQQDGTLEFTAKADILRGGAVTMWPPHPDFYAASHDRRVLDMDAVACDTQGCQLPGNEKAGPVHPTKLISYGTRTLFVWVNITDAQAPVPPLAPTNWFLWHWNSTGDANITNAFDDKGHPFAKKEHAWVLPVDDNGMDSPYADGSKWELQLGGALKGGLSCYSGCAAWTVKYHIVAIASDRVLPQDAYDWACLGDNYCPPANGS